MTDVMISIMSSNVNGLNKLIKTDCMKWLKNNSTRYNLQEIPFKYSNIDGLKRSMEKENVIYAHISIKLEKEKKVKA